MSDDTKFEALQARRSNIRRRSVDQIERIAPTAGSNEPRPRLLEHAETNFLANPEKRQHTERNHRLRVRNMRFEMKHLAGPANSPHSKAPLPNRSGGFEWR